LATPLRRANRLAIPDIRRHSTAMNNPKPAKHRTVRGRLDYVHDKRGPTGREWFTITVNPDGSRTIRAQCEMDEDGLLRDVIWSLDADWRPIDAYVRLNVGGKFQGAGWFWINGTEIEGEILNAETGRLRQKLRLDHPPQIFGAHPVSGDAMKTANFDHASKDKIQTFQGLSTSPLPNGGSGPLLTSMVMTFEFIGEETIAVPAGTFETERYRWHFEQFEPIEIWTMGADHVPVKLRWDELESDYLLTELSGDPK
jgi:hypothetical protein